MQATPAAPAAAIANGSVSDACTIGHGPVPRRKLGICSRLMPVHGKGHERSRLRTKQATRRGPAAGVRGMRTRRIHDPVHVGEPALRVNKGDLLDGFGRHQGLDPLPNTLDESGHADEEDAASELRVEVLDHPLLLGIAAGHALLDTHTNAIVRVGGR